MTAHNAESRPAYVNRDGAMERLCCKKSTLHKLMREGRLEVKKLGTKTLISVNSIDRFIDGLPTIPAKI